MISDIDMSNPGPAILSRNNNEGVLYDPITGNIFAGGTILNLGSTTVNSVTSLQSLIMDATANPTLNYGGVISSPITVPSNLTIPPNVQLFFSGTGRLVWGAGVTITNNGTYTAGPWQIWDMSASGAVWAGLAQSSTGLMMTEHFGAAGNDTADDTAAFNFCAAAAFATLSDIRLLGKTYRITGTVYADNGITTGTTWCPNWYGASAIKTVIHGVGLSAQQAMFQIRGGSGTYTQAGFYDMTFLGDASLPCGMVMLNKGSTWCYRCRFDSCYSGIRLWNQDSLGFTEFCGGDACWFRGNCTNHLEYMVTGGAQSFRGSGLKNHGLSNIADTKTGVLIGAGCKVYNAPMDHEVASTGTTTFIQNNSTLPVTFSGQINVEPSGGMCTLGTINRIWFAGKGVHSGENVQAGTLIQVDDIIINSDSSPTPIGMRKQFTAALTTGANTIGVSGVTNGVGWSGGIQRLVSLQLTNANIAQYDCRYVFEIDINSGISSSGAVNPAIAGSGIRVLREINTQSYGTVSGGVGAGTTVTLTVNSSGQLIVTGASFPTSGVTAYWEEKQISNNLTAFHPQI